MRAQKRTFAQILNNVCDIPLSQLHSPYIKGYNLGANCWRSLFCWFGEVQKSFAKIICMGILLKKRDKPLTHLDLCKKLDLTWKHLGQWKAISLDKRFYEFAFSSLEDMRRVKEVRVWDLFLKSFVFLF